MNDKTKEFRKKIADTFIKSLEESQQDWKKSWKKGWKGLSTKPINFINNKRYRGINKFWLSYVAEKKGSNDPRWGTFKQIQDKGWKVRKGAKGEQVEYWMPYDSKEKRILTWEEFNNLKLGFKRMENVIFIPKYYTVFNGMDIEGIPPIQVQENLSIEAEQIIKTLSKNMGVEIIHDGNDRAFYNLNEDKIHLSKPSYFKTGYGYNSTALHELAHSTGAAHRLDRNISNEFGSNEYAFEELVAEISSCFMSENLQIEEDESHMNNHKAYIQVG